MSVGKKEKINVLSLFDGMSCGQIALERAGIKVNKYYASEIDKHAIKVTQHNYPNTIQLGSVTEVNVKDLEPIDLLIGGSPCQSFSFAGKRNGMTTSCNEEIYTLERYLELKADGFQFEGESYLFWEYMRILTDIRKYNPDVLFLLENVEMGAKWERVLSEAIGIYGVHINSALVSAQNRKRIYWTNIRVREEGLFGELHSDIPQPKDKGILLRDILETDVPDKYYLSEKMIRWLEKHAEKRETGIKILDGTTKTGCVTATAQVKQNLTTDYVCCAMRGRGDNNERQLEPQLSGKANCFTAGGNSGGLYSDMTLVGCIKFGRTDEAKEIRKRSMAKGVDYTPHSKKEITGLDFDKMNTLTTASNKDNLVMQLNQSTESNGCQPYQQNRVYDINGISPALMAQMSCGSHAIMIPEATRKGFIEVKPGECFDFENPKSETRRGRKMTDKSNNLMASTTNFMKYEGIEIRENYAVTGDGYEQDNRVYYENGKSGALDTKSKTRQKVLLNYEHSLTPDQLAKFNPDVDTSKHNALTQAIGRGGSSSEYMDSVSKVSKLSLRIRRLTPVECERLQTVPDNYTSCVNDTQRYKMLGNGWTVEVIKHIFSFLNGFKKTKHNFPYKWTLKDAVFTKDKGKVFSCFACGGGSTMGYKLAGFDVLGCNEIDPKMIEAYKANHNPKYAYLEPIQTFKLREDLPQELYELDILDGSPPCSSFSMAGNREKDWGKEKVFKEGQAEQVLDTLFFDFIDLAKKLQPKVVIAENVKGLLLGEAKNYVRQIYREFDLAGYYVKHWLLDASKMGVPQRRERVFFIALRKDLAEPFMEQVDMFTVLPKLKLEFDEPQINFGEFYEAGVDDRPASRGKMYEYWKNRQKGDESFCDTIKRVEGSERCFTNHYLYSDIVPMTYTSNSDVIYLFDEYRKPNKTESCCIGSYPQDYNFTGVKYNYLIGMSVPPVMTAQIAKQVYEQWLSKI